MENVLSHFGQWWAFAVWIIIFGVFLAFIPFYRKSQVKPAGAFMAFVVAMAFEMFGIPLSMYFITWVFGYTLPEGVLWGHTLVQYIGLWGTYIGTGLYMAGGILIISGWRKIHKFYWSKEEGKGALVTGGIYAYIRHPQYTGFLLITLGMIFEWATIPLLIMWPILVFLYYRLAKKEEQYMIEEFGYEYEMYRSRTGMFLPGCYKFKNLSPQKPNE